MTEQEAYDSLAGFIQDYIYEKKWEHLNPLQIATIEALQEPDHNLLLMAGTAQGKTEAAFLPAISKICRPCAGPANTGGPSGIGILYISPLKALINDQFIRIEDMLRGQDIAITKWHGDSSVYRKEKLMEDP
ncbi:MAG: DEAD/DEAH box helicase, partial [Eubacterium sp.]|nr:DEAD/DEAH box helicase [Eubacterium sp.]